jgi:hypothetical protein
MELVSIMERPGNHGSIPGRGRRLFPTRSRPASVFTQSPIQRAQGAIYQEVMRLGREADRTSLSSVKVRNVWSYTSTPLTVFMVWFLFKHRKSLIFYLYNYYYYYYYYYYFHDFFAPVVCSEVQLTIF